MNDMRLEKDGASKAASQLTAVGEDLMARFKAAAGTIGTLGSAAVWGTDEGGQNAYQKYQEAAPKVLENGEELTAAVARLGPTAQQAIAGLLDADQVSAGLLGKAGPPSAGSGGPASGSGGPSGGQAP